MSEVTEFLLARIAEDEESTKTASTPFYREMFNGWHRGEVGGAFIGFTDRFTPERVLAECKAKRQILKRAHESNGYWGRDVERAMLTPYLDHPDCRHEWWQ